MSPASSPDREPLGQRRGARPRTTAPQIPHQQIDQQPSDPTVRAWLADELFGLPGVEERPSGISVPGARALWLTVEGKGPDAFLTGREFAHLHPPPDLSLHIVLPPAEAARAIAAGWAEWHPFVLDGRLPPTVIMLYAPRDHDEADVVRQLVHDSRNHATSCAGVTSLADTCTTGATPITSAVGAHEPLA